VQKLKRLLTVIAAMTPFTPNMTDLGNQVEIQRSNLPQVRRSVLRMNGLRSA